MTETHIPSRRLSGWRAARAVLAALILLGAAGTGLAKDRKHDKHKGRDSESPVRIERVGKLPSGTIKESSGIVASRRQEGVFWTHGDSGNAAQLFAVARDGRLLGRFRVSASNVDWEDIAADADGNLYIGDIGDNDGKRGEIRVYRVSEPELKSEARGPVLLTVAATWHLQIPGGPANCESLFVRDGYGYLVEKHSGKSPARLFRFPLKAQGGTSTLEVVTHLGLGSPATAADLSADGRRLAVMTRKGLWLYAVDGDLKRLGTPAPRFLQLPPLQYEAVCFVPEGLVMTAESGEIFLVRMP